eukprot:40562-Amphidinium_carterae.2
MAGELAKVPAAYAGALQNRGSVTLGGMGPSATNNAVKAAPEGNLAHRRKYCVPFKTHQKFR